MCAQLGNQDVSGPLKGTPPTVDDTRNGLLTQLGL